jgi:hypothetical protein
MTWHDDRHPAVINTQYIHIPRMTFFIIGYIFSYFSRYSALLYSQSFDYLTEYRFQNLNTVIQIKTCVIVKYCKNHNKINDLIYILTQPKRKKNPPIHQKNKKNKHTNTVFCVQRRTSNIKHINQRQLKQSLLYSIY